jgi:hypothetical protein
MGSSGSSPDKKGVPSIKMLQNEAYFLKLVQENGRPDCVSAKLQDALKGGYSQLARKCELTFQDGETITAMAKVMKNDMLANYYAKKLKMDREGQFYQYAASQDHHIGECYFPKSYMQVIDTVQGKNAVVMEYMDGAHNLWRCFGELEHIKRPDLDRPIKLGDDVVTAYQVTKMAVTALGDLHGHFWMDKDLREANKHWLMRNDWCSGENQQAYMELVGEMAWFYNMMKKRLTPSLLTLKLDPLVEQCLDVATKTATWENLQAKMKDPKYQWTVCHADCHPGNWVWDPKQKRIVLIDFETVGLMNGLADVATILVFRSNPEFRRKHEKQLVTLYYERLLAGGKCTADSYPFEQCWEDYIYEGAARMVYNLIVVVSFMGNKNT